MEGRQAKPTHKFYNGKKAFKQPSTCSTEKRSRTHQQIQYIPIIHPERQKRSCQSIHLPLYLHSTTSDTSWDSRRSNCKLVCEGLQAICMQKRNSRIHHIRQCQDIPERFPRAQYPQKPNTKHNRTPKVSCLPPEKVEVHYRMSSLVGWLLWKIDWISQMKTKKSYQKHFSEFYRIKNQTNWGWGYTQQSPTHFYAYRY